MSILLSVIEKAKPGEDFQKKEWLLISDFGALLPKPLPSTFASGMVVEREDMYKTCESIYYGDADIDSTLKDLTERCDKAYQVAIKNGTGHEIKIENYDPMNPALE